MTQLLTINNLTLPTTDNNNALVFKKETPRHHLDLLCELEKLPAVKFGGHVAKAVMIHIAQHFNTKAGFLARIYNYKIAEFIGRSVRTVQRAYTALKKAGFLDIQHNKNGKNSAKNIASTFSPGAAVHALFESYSVTTSRQECHAFKEQPDLNKKKEIKNKENFYKNSKSKAAGQGKGSTPPPVKQPTAAPSVAKKPKATKPAPIAAAALLDKLNAKANPTKAATAGTYNPWKNENADKYAAYNKRQQEKRGIFQPVLNTKFIDSVQADHLARLNNGIDPTKPKTEQQKTAVSGILDKLFPNRKRKAGNNAPK